MKNVERNYLEIRSLNDLSELPNPSSKLKIELVSPPDFQLNKFFYKQIGKKYFWKDRLDWSNKNWIDYVSNKKIFT